MDIWVDSGQRPMHVQEEVARKKHRGMDLMQEGRTAAERAKVVLHSLFNNPLQGNNVFQCFQRLSWSAGGGAAQGCGGGGSSQGEPELGQPQGPEDW